MMSPFKGAVTPKAKRAESSVKLSARFLFNDRMMSLIAGSNNLTSLRLWSTHSDNLMKPMIRFLWQSTPFWYVIVLIWNLMNENPALASYHQCS
jgi:hypothetical protein